MFMYNKPDKAMFELTNWCNLRCRMCGIWEEPGKKIFSLALFDKILKSKSMHRLKYMALTGGEPFLLKNLEEYYNVTKKNFPKAHINISTNGFLTERTVKFFEKIDRKKASLTISYDGVISHDYVRRVDGSAKRLIETAINIRDRFPDVELSLKLTVTPYNYKEILDTAKQCKSLNIPFLFKTMEKINCHQNRYTSEISEPDYSQEMLDSMVAQSKEILRLGIKTNQKYISQLIRRSSGKDVKCNCSSKVLFIGIDGNVFLCRKKEPIGNVYDKDFDHIWASEKKDLVAAEMKSCKNSSASITFVHE